MPIYAYFCSNCDLETDIIVPVSEVKVAAANKTEINRSCEKCGEVMHRMLTKANFTTKPDGGFFGSKPRA